MFSQFSHVQQCLQFVMKVISLNKRLEKYFHCIIALKYKNCIICKIVNHLFYKSPQYFIILFIFHCNMILCVQRASYNKMMLLKLYKCSLKNNLKTVLFSHLLFCYKIIQTKNEAII